MTDSGDIQDFSLDSLANTTGAWLNADGPESDIVVSTRIRLARNIAGYAFISRADEESRRQIVRSVVTAAQKADVGTPLRFVDAVKHNELDLRLLMERQLISRELVEMSGPRGVLIGEGEHISVMINEEDHLRIQVLNSGYRLRETWQQINAVDDALEQYLTYAFDEQLGYLTACPTNVGTGIRISVMLHLPGLVMAKDIQQVHSACQKIQVAVRGLYGEGSQAMGDFYQISNQITLGKSEEDLLEQLGTIIPRIIEFERRIRQALAEKDRSTLADRASRALGVLKSAQTMTSQEAMRLFSQVRMGLGLGLISGVSQETLNELFVQTQPSHLQKLHGSSLESAARNELRAARIREKLGN